MGFMKYIDFGDDPNLANQDGGLSVGSTVLDKMPYHAYASKTTPATLQVIPDSQDSSSSSSSAPRGLQKNLKSDLNIEQENDKDFDLKDSL